MITKRVTNFISILMGWFLHVNNITFKLLLELDMDLLQSSVPVGNSSTVSLELRLALLSLWDPPDKQWHRPDKQWHHPPDKQWHHPDKQWHHPDKFQLTFPTGNLLHWLLQLNLCVWTYLVIWIQVNPILHGGLVENGPPPWSRFSLYVFCQAQFQLAIQVQFHLIWD